MSHAASELPDGLQFLHLTKLGFQLAPFSDIDLLFLTPRQWWAPVWQPLLASSAFVVVALALLLVARRR